MERLIVVLALLLLAPAVHAAPEQVRLGFTSSDPGSAMTVTWYEASPNLAPIVKLTTPEGDKTFAAQQMQGPTLGFVYEAQLTGLQPGVNYTYDVGGRAFSFVTPGTDGAFRFIGIGDHGVKSNSRKAVDTIVGLAPDLVLHPGDISYAEGDQVAWNEWFTMTEPVAAALPWTVVIGNHEAAFMGAKRNGYSLVNPAEQTYFSQRFALPGNEMWYSFDWEGVHFVALDTYSQPTIPQEEIDWLAADLKANADAAWTIVYLHQPPYSSNRHGSSELVQDAFVKIFEENGVDLVVTAHDHGYERTYPILGGKPTVTSGRTFAAGNGIVYIVTGGGGNSLYDAWEDPAPSWSAARGSFYHVTEFIVTPDRIEGRVVPTTGEKFSDTFALVRPGAQTGAGEAPGATTGGAPVPAPAPLLALALVGALAVLRRRRG